jgi:anaerobic ribonucleoside-triphosphate reductase activating protein
MTAAPTIHAAAVVPCTESEGPHTRWALWTRGCTLQCAGCCNPELFERDGRDPSSVATLLESIEHAQRHHGIEGITILGGEPLEQLDGVTALATGARRLTLGVIVFSGYTLAEAQRIAGFDRLWRSLDTFVDGRFEARAPDRHRRFVGSTNQRIHHRTTRYASPSLWLGDGGAEARIAPDGALSLHGSPARVQRLLRQLTR